MSRQYDILWCIARWSAVREIPQREVVSLIYDVFGVSGQFDSDMDDQEEELTTIQKQVSAVYAAVLQHKEDVIK